MTNISAIIRDTLISMRGSLFTDDDITVDTDSYLRDDLKVDAIELGVLAMAVEDACEVKFTDDTVNSWERVGDIEASAGQREGV